MKTYMQSTIVIAFEEDTVEKKIGVNIDVKSNPNVPPHLLAELLRQIADNIEKQNKSGIILPNKQIIKPN